MTTEIKPADAELIAECRAEEDAASAIRLSCGSCGEPQSIGTATCSECGFNPAWIVEPCPECHGAPANVSAPVGQSDFSTGGCRNCDGGWVETSGATARVIAWRLAFDRSGSGKTARTTPVEILRELTEAGDRWLPDPAAEYDRRQALRVQAFLGPSGKSGEIAGREIERPILFEDEPEAEIFGWAFEYHPARARHCFGADVSIEAGSLIFTDTLAELPLAVVDRLRAMAAEEGREAEQHRRRLADGRDLLARLKKETRAVEERTRARDVGVKS